MSEDAHHLTGGPDGREARAAATFGAVAQRSTRGLRAPAWIILLRWCGDA